MRFRGNKHLSLLFAVALLFALAHGAAAHDIPSDAVVRAFVKPEGQRLRLLVRTPLVAMRDLDIPELEHGYLDVARLAPQLPDAATLWISGFIDMYEGDARLPKPRVVATQVSLPSDASFASYDEALAHVTGPKLTSDAHVYWNQLLFDVLFEYPTQSDRSAFSIHPALNRLAARVVTALRFLPPGGAERAYEFPGDPGLVRLDPRWHQAAGRFVELGFFHILDGTDHLLFLLCLVIPLRRFRALVPVVTAFTVAHSITLIASVYGLAPDALWFPPLIETLIAISIFYMALENIVGGAPRRRWMVAFGFGLVHGFGFSFALRQTMQFAGSHLLTSLLSFNLGVELGQLLVLLVLIPALDALFRWVVAERMGTIILSALVAHTGWHWMIERADTLRHFRFEWTAPGAGFWAGAMLVLIVIVAAAGAAWLFSRRAYLFNSARRFFT